MTPPPGFLPGPTPLAAVLISVAVRALPTASRNRYHDEFRAELCCLRPGRQLADATNVLLGSLALRRALQEDDVTALKADRRLGCRIGRHHYRVINGDNTENRSDRHLECVHCGKIKEIDMYEPSDGSTLGGGVGLV